MGCGCSKKKKNLCSAKTKQGKRCRNSVASKSTKYCWVHL
uniref:Uncharacterized protein n=1 Tax=Marseillevirus sp. TaxID=2809551 RepID=A0AA96ESQ6_9VIRU|nr:hypothetical protein MarDSR_403 [Marseillevirus sp.]